MKVSDKLHHELHYEAGEVHNNMVCCIPYLVEEFVYFNHLVRVYSELSHVCAVLQQSVRD